MVISGVEKDVWKSEDMYVVKAQQRPGQSRTQPWMDEHKCRRLCLKAQNILESIAEARTNASSRCTSHEGWPEMMSWLTSCVGA